MPIQETYRDPTLTFPPIPDSLDYEYFDLARYYPLKAEMNYSDCIAWWLAEFSLLAYEKRITVKYVVRDNQFSFFQYFNGPTTQAFIAANDQVIILVFRGTAVNNMGAFSDIATDINFRLVPMEGGKVHQGFLNASREINQENTGVLSVVKQLKQEKPDRQIFFTGHSLGAACATVCAAKCEFPLALYTFGSPKVGDKDFSSKLIKPHFRIVNQGDIVARLPPSMPIAKFPGNFYEHNGTPFLIQSGGQLIEGMEDIKQETTTTSVDESKPKTISSTLSNLGTKAVDKVFNFTKAIKETNETDSSLFKSTIRVLFDSTNIDAHAPINYALHLRNWLVKKHKSPFDV